VSLLKIVVPENMKAQYLDYILTRDKMNAGFDLFVPKSHVIRKLTTSHAIDHEVKVEFTKSYPQYNQDLGNINTLVTSYVLMIPRSSISKTGLRLANAIGVIDSNYRGNVIAKVDNLGAQIEVKKGKALFQLLVGENCEIQITDKLSTTKRGEKGFGSTGATI